MNLSPPLISRQISDLEAHLGIRLFNRTTRHVELTDAGERYYRGCIDVLGQLDGLETDTRAQVQQPSGLLRISIPMDFGRLFLGQAIREFLSRAPEMRMEVIYEDRPANLVQELVDVAVRIGNLPDSTMISRKLGQACISCFASADYLATHGEPTKPSELCKHRVLHYSLSRIPGQWLLGEDAQRLDISNNWRLAANNGSALAEAACRGMGIVRLPQFLVEGHLADGRLVEVLRDFRSPPLDICAVYQHRKFKPAKISAFVAFLEEFFSRRRDWLPRPV